MRKRKNIDVLIYFEHVSRELESCFRLRYELERLGLTVAVAPVHRNRYKTVLRYRPRMVVVPFLFADEKDRLHEYFTRIYGPGVIFLNLHHEQFYNEMTKGHFMPQNDVAREVYHLSWTDKFASDLIEYGVKEDRVMVCGHPRTDNNYLRPAYEIARQKEGYEKLVFIPTSFTWALVDEEYFLKNPTLDREKFFAHKKVVVETVPVFFRAVRDMAAKHPHIKFILRPHPFETITRYTAALEASKEGPLENNIVIVREGSVYDWIQISDLVIGWFTTVSMESQLFGRRNLIYQPVKVPPDMQIDFIPLYDEIINTYERLESIVADIENYNPEDREISEHVANIFGKADGTVNRNIAENIFKILQSGGRLSYNRGEAAPIRMKYFTKDIPKNIMIRLNLLPRYAGMFSGIMEDLLTERQLEGKYRGFKKRVVE